MDGLDYFHLACSRNPQEYPKGVNGKFRCPCCEYFTLDECCAYDICPVCFWEDDGAINNDDFGGPNGMTLGEGKIEYMRNKCVTAHCREHVREPLESEMAK